MFMAAVVLFGAFTVITAMVGSYETLLSVRFCAGLGFGAALPNMMAIAAEISRPEKAASTAAIMFCGMPVGGGLSALVTQVLPSGFDWRVLFLMGGVLPILLVPALWKFMPETLSRAREGQPRSAGRDAGLAHPHRWRHPPTLPFDGPFFSPAVSRRRPRGQ